MKKTQILAIIFLLIIFSISFYISGIISVFYLISSILFYSVITYVIIGGFRKIKNFDYKFFDFGNYKNFFEKFIYRISLLIVSLYLVFGLFVYYELELSPAKMPVYTISNGSKTVVFQSMSHIGSENFYTHVKNSIRDLKNNGYVLFFEGVRPGTKENQESFDKALGIKMNQNLYKNFSKLYGLTNQDNSDFLGLVNNLDFNVDVSIDDIVKFYKELKIQTNISSTIEKDPIDINSVIIEQLSQLRENELKILRLINKSMISVILKNDNLQNAIKDEFGNKQLFEVILNKRNQILADEIINSKYDKIVITYGLLHFNGILELLQQSDIKWQIKKIDYVYPLK